MWRPRSSLERHPPHLSDPQACSWPTAHMRQCDLCRTIPGRRPTTLKLESISIAVGRTKCRNSLECLSDVVCTQANNSDCTAGESPHDRDRTSRAERAAGTDLTGVRLPTATARDSLKLTHWKLTQWVGAGASKNRQIAIRPFGPRATFG